MSLDTPPEILSTRAIDVWRHVVDTTTHLRPEHRDTLVAYCEAVSRHEQACLAIQELPQLVITSTKGTAMLAPEIRLARDEATSVRQLAHELKITPLTQDMAVADAAAEALREFRERRDRELDGA